MASRYFLNIGTDYGSTANWSATSGGAGGASVPTSIDDVFFDANSGNCNLNANRTATSINFTGYTGTINFSSFTLTNSNNLTLSPTMTMTATTGYLNIQPNLPGLKTVTSNGYIVPINVRIQFTNTGQTITLANNFETAAGKELRIVATTLGTINTNQIRVNGSLYFQISTNASVNGSTLIKLVGTGSVESSTTTGPSRLALEINTAGTITFNGTTTLWCNFTYTAGTVVATGSTLLFFAPNATNISISLGSLVNWYNLSFDNNGFNPVVTLTSNTNVTNNLSFRAFAQALRVNGSTIYCSGSLDGNSGDHTVDGSTTPTAIIMNGTGTLTTSTTSPILGFRSFSLPVTINTTGLITLIGNFYYSYSTTLGTITTFTITTPNNFDCVTKGATFFIGGFTSSAPPISVTLSLNSDFQFSNLSTYNNRLNVTGGNIHVLNTLTIGVKALSYVNEVTDGSVTGCDIYLWGDLISHSIESSSSSITIGNTLYLVGPKNSIFQTSDNSSTSYPSARMNNSIIFNKTGKLSIIGRNTKFSKTTSVTTQIIRYISGEIEMPRLNDRISFGAANDYAISVYGKVSKMRLRNVRFGATSTRVVTFYDDFFSGGANLYLNIQGISTAAPYDDNSSTYLITNASSRKFDSHFTKISNVIWSGPSLNLTNKNSNNRTVNSNTNQLAHGFAKNSPIIAKEPMFGKLVNDPVVTKIN